ncbi:hypothetical protein BGZ83_001929 [Gryganskiella cystojenkinii]|nr:hypothetical protein BGZ83_001929 [Gryganskiella cystojenkinii]
MCKFVTEQIKQVTIVTDKEKSDSSEHPRTRSHSRTNDGYSILESLMVQNGLTIPVMEPLIPFSETEAGIAAANASRSATAPDSTANAADQPVGSSSRSQEGGGGDYEEDEDQEEDEEDEDADQTMQFSSSDIRHRQ